MFYNLYTMLFFNFMQCRIAKSFLKKVEKIPLCLLKSGDTSIIMGETKGTCRSSKRKDGKEMGQIKRNRKQIASTVDPELWEAFRGLSEKTRIPASRLLDEAMEDLLLKYKVISQKEKTP